MFPYIPILISYIPELCILCQDDTSWYEYGLWVINRFVSANDIVLGVAIKTFLSVIINFYGNTPNVIPYDDTIFISLLLMLSYFPFPTSVPSYNDTLRYER